MEPPIGNKRIPPPPLNWAPPPVWTPPVWTPPNHHQPPPPNWAPPPNRYYSQPPPSTHYSQTHQQPYYTPQPASPYYPPPPVEPHHFELAQSSDFGAFEDLASDDVVPETPNPTPTEVVEEEDDGVEETDARGKKKFPGRKPREIWTEEQEVALAKAWIQISECKKFGNEQKADGFWKRVLQHYATTLGSTNRTFHSLTTKWKVMNAEMGNFNGLWIQAFRANRSGCNDLDITTTALSDFYTKTDKHFTHLPAWNVVKEHDKWKQQECFANIVGMGIPASSGSSKRKSSDFEEASNDNVLPDMNEDPCPPLPPKKIKKKQVASSSSSATSVADELTNYTQRRSRYMEIKEEKEDLAKRLMATQLEGEMFKNRQREWKVFKEPHDDIVDPVLLECILEEKRALGKKNGWPCNF